MVFVRLPVITAVRTAEEWTTGSAVAGFALLFLVVAALAWALFVTGRR